MTQEKHFVYGGGLVGCLYNFGPHQCSEKSDAVEALVEVYLTYSTEDLSEERAKEIESDMRETFASNGIYYFPWDCRKYVGADYCEISGPYDGPPEEDYE